jgi:hypothetical protein
MPIFLQFPGITGDLKSNGHEKPIESGANGGVWKTTNFLTADGSGPIAVSRISLSSGGGVDAQEALPTRKAAELFERARSAPGGKLYVATQTGVFVESFDKQGRLLVGTEGGVWSGHNIGALRNVSGSNTFSRPGIGVLKSSDGGRTWSTKRVPMVELTVSDRGNTNGRTIRLKDVTISPGPRGIVELRYSSIDL